MSERGDLCEHGVDKEHFCEKCNLLYGDPEWGAWCCVPATDEEIEGISNEED